MDGWANEFMSESTYPFARVYFPRFDIMGHLMLDTVGQGLDMVRALTVEDNGIDGSKAYFYGEGERDQHTTLNPRKLSSVHACVFSLLLTLSQAGSLVR